MVSAVIASKSTASPPLVREGLWFPLLEEHSPALPTTFGSDRLGVAHEQAQDPRLRAAGYGEPRLAESLAARTKLHRFYPSKML